MRAAKRRATPIRGARLRRLPPFDHALIDGSGGELDKEARGPCYLLRSVTDTIEE
jgi:hypothetical protein